MVQPEPGKQFTVTDGPASPRRRGEVAMYLDGRWHSIALGEAPSGVTPADRQTTTGQHPGMERSIAISRPGGNVGARRK